MIKVNSVSKIYTSDDFVKRIISRITNQKLEEFVALKAVSMVVNSGEIVGLIGPNGAGKTTLAKVISGLLIPNGGEVKVDDYNPTELSKEFKLKYALYRGEVRMMDEGIVVRDSLEDHLKLYEKTEVINNDFVNLLIEELGVGELLDELPEDLSQGQRTLVEFVYAISHQPSTMILDEPTNGLDIVAIEKFNNVLKLLKEKYNCSIIITSHNLQNIISVADRILLINSGKIVLEGTPHEILSKETGERLVRIELDSWDESFNNKFDKFKKYGEIIDNEPPVITFSIMKQDIQQFLLELLKEMVVMDITVIEPPIESIFKRYFQK